MFADEPKDVVGLLKRSNKDVMRITRFISDNDCGSVPMGCGFRGRRRADCCGMITLFRCRRQAGRGRRRDKWLFEFESAISDGGWS